MNLILLKLQNNTKKGFAAANPFLIYISFAEVTLSTKSVVTPMLNKIVPNIAIIFPPLCNL